jgi:hypothetical protein
VSADKKVRFGENCRVGLRQRTEKSRSSSTEIRRGDAAAAPSDQ